VIFVAHGWDTHTMGVANVVEAQRAIGIPLPEVSGLITIYVELAGGVLLVIGALTRLLAVALTGVMLGAWVFVHAGNGIFVQDGGYELVMILAVAAAVLAVAGPAGSAPTTYSSSGWRDPRDLVQGSYGAPCEGRHDLWNANEGTEGPRRYLDLDLVRRDTDRGVRHDRPRLVRPPDRTTST